MIQITMNNGIYDEWKPEQYTDYMYDGKCFIIIKGEKWVGIYNIDSVRRIVINKQNICTGAKEGVKECSKNK